MLCLNLSRKAFSRKEGLRTERWFIEQSALPRSLPAKMGQSPDGVDSLVRMMTSLMCIGCFKPINARKTLRS